MEIYEFDVDWNNTSNSTFTLTDVLTPAAYSLNVNGVSQPGTATLLDDLSVMLMFRLAYRDFGTHESMVINHTVSASGRAAPRWYELRKSGGSWSIYQQGTYAPDNEERWMGSIAMNANGDIALGYSVSSNNTFPSIRYTGRRAGDPLGQMTIDEVEVKAGLSSQTGINRWGDYSAMSVDPVDDTTFWFTTEYMKSGGWGTYITSFNLGPFSEPTAYAGPDTTICKDVFYDTDGLVTATQAVMWTTTGDGTFQDPTKLKTKYLRGNEDLNNEEVTLALTAFGFQPGLEATDSVIVFLSDDPFADAGNDTLLCAGEVLQLSGIAANHDVVAWRTAGDGTFSDTTALNAIYTPGSGDLSNGSVELTLVAKGITGCVGEDEDEMLVTIDECTGLDELGEDGLSLGVRPNPNTGIFSYDIYSETPSDVRLDVLNMQGQLIFTQQLSRLTGAYTGSINIGDNPRGIYYLRINNGQDVRIEKVLVQ
jgi:hypothetical protein